MRQFGVETGSALLDPGEVKTRGVGYGLNKVGIGRVSIGSGDRGVLSHGQCGNGLRSRIAEVGVLGAAAIARPPTGVDGELHQVGETSELIGSSGLAAGQGAEAIEVDGVGTLRFQVRVDEDFVAQLVFGVVMNVLRHIAVQR